MFIAKTLKIKNINPLNNEKNVIFELENLLCGRVNMYIDYANIKPWSNYLNYKFRELNQKGIYFLEDRKCNFDVELGRDMLVDYDKNDIETFVLWSGDSDFAEPIKHLLKIGKKVIIFATSGKVSRELNNLCKQGLLIFDIKKIRNFICWNNEIIKAKGTSVEAPKL